MRRIKNRILFLAVLLMALSSSELGAIEWHFSPDSLGQHPTSYIFSYPETVPLNVNCNFSLPVRIIYLESALPLTSADFAVGPADRIKITSLPPENTTFENRTTGIDSSSPSPLLHDVAQLRNNVLNIDRIDVEGRTVYAVALLPLTLDSADNLVLARTIALSSASSSAICIGHNELINRFKDNAFSRPRARASQNTDPSGLPLGIDYVIVTAPALAGAFRPLVTFKNACGLNTAVALTDSIFAHYGGVDNSEKLRNYLEDFYRGGGRFVMLGGDESIVPVRYLLYYNVRTGPFQQSDLLPSDLYYADLTGDWDKDGDNIWGEPNDDAPDLIPELRVGRIPAKNDSVISNYITKLLNYYTDPGHGDYTYLNKALFFSSDEMRDYPAEGQHGYIASAYPSPFLIDTFSTIESPSGGDPNPDNPDGASAIQKISEGFGVVNIIAHGRTDGFIVKSANYGDWPASFILTGPITGGHGTVTNLERNGKTSFYYSLACDVGGFDLDSLGGGSSDYSLVERLISAPDGGAVGMVANSRWGWVYSSYLLHQAFFKYLFGAAYGNPFDAMSLSWLDCSYLRDLIYGQNFFGDPSMTIYRDIPSRMDVTVNSSPNGTFRGNVTEEGRPVEGAHLILSCGGNILEEGFSDASGDWPISDQLNYDSSYTITALKDGFIIAQLNYIPSIAADFEEKNELPPTEFLLKQNYPNPFNPQTKIEFSLPARTSSKLEIFNLLGQRVRQMDFDEKPAGQYSVLWNGKNEYGTEVSSGIYFYRLSAGKLSQTKKMVLLR
ncbi:exported hypothetical protein [Candidatus Zixiibacteriota bacterium]|nr:exported hypothetical protein [candidate division Zixibacteria bacterium]